MMVHYNIREMGATACRDLFCRSPPRVRTKKQRPEGEVYEPKTSITGIISNVGIVLRAMTITISDFRF